MKRHRYAYTPLEIAEYWNQKTMGSAPSTRDVVRTQFLTSLANLSAGGDVDRARDIARMFAEEFPIAAATLKLDSVDYVEAIEWTVVR